MKAVFCAKSNPMNSWEAIFDNLTMFLTFALGCYTLYLFCQTVYYTRAQSSLVDSHKYDLYRAMSRDQKKLEIQKGASYLKKKRPLTISQICYAILNEKCISLKSFIPVYGPDRNLDSVSKIY